MTSPMDPAEIAAIEWPREIWAEDRAENSPHGLHVFSVHATVARWEGDREGEFHRYVDGDTLDSLQRYHDTMIADLRAQLAAMTAERDAAVARVLKAAGEEYILEHVMETNWHRQGRHSAVRGMMVRLDLYPQLEAAIDCAITEGIQT